MTMSNPQVRTQHLTLLPLDPEAASALPDERDRAAQIIGAELSPGWPARHLLGVLPRQVAAPPEHARYGIWVIVERATGEVIGDIGFFGPPGPDATLEVGYSIAPERRRRGYATEAARAIVTWAFEQPGVRTILARCDHTNEPSIRILAGVGFSRTGQTDEQLHWRLDSDD